jgi:hypothetical protein
VESPDWAVSLFDEQLYGVPDLRGVYRHGGSSQTQAARISAAILAMAATSAPVTRI